MTPDFRSTSILKTSGIRLGFFALATVIMTGGCSGFSSGLTDAAKPDAVFTKERAPINVPDLKNEASASDDHRTILALMERAEKENKVLLLDVTAAWCGPCQMFAKDLADHPEALKEFAEQNVILAKAEYEKYPTSRLYDLNDFLPMYAKFFPSFHSYTPGKGPGKGWKLLGASNSVADLKTTITKLVPKDFLTVEQIKAYALATAKKRQNGTSETIENEDAATMSIYGAARTYTYGETRDLIRTFTGLAATYPKSYSQMWAAELKRSLSEYVGAGAVTMEALAQDFPEEGNRLRDLSNKSFSLTGYVYKLANRLHLEGLKATADNCEATWTDYKGQLVRGTLTEAEYQKKSADVEAQATEICAGLDVRANGVSEEVKAKVAKLDQTKLADWQLVAGLEQIDQAVAIYEKHYQAFVSSYEKYEKSNAEDLQKAKDKKDEAAVKEAEADIARLEFQRAYHKSVADTVESDLRAKLPVRTITILN